jgi:dolichol-phosphate mannosyltransferase
MSSEAPSVAVVIPCYQVERPIRAVIESLPSWVTRVIAVDDGSTERTCEVLRQLEAEDVRVRVLEHPENRGVGGAMVTGFKEALAIGADYVVKIDGDGQMRAGELPRLLAPLIDGRADFAKGNRMLNPHELALMSRTRLIGNIVLSFLTKVASGCWHVLDVQNGYLALTNKLLWAMPLDRLESGYCFENSLLVHAAIQNAAVADVPMPAVYGSKTSSMRIGRVLLSLPPKLVSLLLVRLFMRHVVHDLSMVAVYLAGGVPLLVFGLVFGGYHWWLSATSGTPAPTGTVVLALLTFLLGFILVLQAVDHDIRSSPRPRSPRQELSDEQVVSHFRTTEP